MSDKPKRRWFQFSLKTLLVVVILAAVPSGLIARSRRCSRQAAFHKRLIPFDEILKNGKWADAFKREHGTVYSSDPVVSDYEMAWIAYHMEAADAYDKVSKMPWLPLALRPPPKISP